MFNIELNDQLRRELWVDAYKACYNSNLDASDAIRTASNAVSGFDDFFNGRLKTSETLIGTEVFTDFVPDPNKPHSRNVAAWLIENNKHLHRAERIAQTLNEKNIPTTTGIKWSTKNVQSTLLGRNLKDELQAIREGYASMH